MGGCFFLHNLFFLPVSISPRCLHRGLLIVIVRDRWLDDFTIKKRCEQRETVEGVCLNGSSFCYHSITIAALYQECRRARKQRKKRRARFVPVPPETYWLCSESFNNCLASV